MPGKPPKGCPAPVLQLARPKGGKSGGAPDEKPLRSDPACPIACVTPPLCEASTSAHRDLARSSSGRPPGQAPERVRNRGCVQRGGGVVPDLN